MLIRILILWSNKLNSWFITKFKIMALYYIILFFKISSISREKPMYRVTRFPATGKKWDLLILMLHRPGGSSGRFWRWNTDFGHIKFWVPQIKSVIKWKADLKKPIVKSHKFKRVKATDKWNKVFKNGPSKTCGTKYSRMDQVKLVEGSL